MVSISWVGAGKIRRAEGSGAAGWAKHLDRKGRKKRCQDHGFFMKNFPIIGILGFSGFEGCLFSKVSRCFSFGGVPKHVFFS